MKVLIFFLILVLTIEKRLKLNLRVHAQGDIGVRVGTIYDG